MKKKLESELISIAHRILKLKGKEDVIKMHVEVSILFEKLAVLKFAHENSEIDLPTIGSNSSFFGTLDDAFNNKVSDTIEVEDKIYINMDEVENETIMEQATEKIKDIVAQMPLETQKMDTFLEAIIPQKPSQKNDFDAITADFKNMPIFDPVSKVKNGISTEKKSLNDSIKNRGLNIGLNDKIAFIKHLFDGKNEDYDRVISQLITFNSLNEAQHFIQNIVKPDYNNWEHKEGLEERFFQIITSKF